MDGSFLCSERGGAQRGHEEIAPARKRGGQGASAIVRERGKERARRGRVRERERERDNARKKERESGEEAATKRADVGSQSNFQNRSLF